MKVAVPALETLEGLVEASGVTCACWDEKDNRWLLAPGLNATLGLEPTWATWDNEGWGEHLHPDDGFDFAEAMGQFLSDGQFASTTVRLRHKNGSWRWFRCWGKTRGASKFIVLRDETEARQEHAALVDSQMRLRSLYDATPVAIILWSREGRITDWNLMASKVFGHGRETAIGEKLAPLLIAPADYENFSASVKSAIKDNAASQIVCRSLTAEGKEILCDWRSVALRATGGTLMGVLSLAQDVTATRAAEKALRRARDQSEALSQAKTEFLAIISHELRTPLNGVLGMAQLLEMSVTEPDLELVRSIRGSGENLLAIINGIVEYTEIDARPLDASIEEMAPAETLTITAERPALHAAQKGLTFESRLDERLWSPMLGDRRSFEKIASILLDNAVKFTDHGGVSVVLEADVGDDDRIEVRLAVSDTGIGIPPERIKQLFLPFRQGESTIQRVHEGLGLGLALAKKLIDRLGGSIAVESTPGAGTTFVARIPLRRPKEPQASPAFS